MKLRRNPFVYEINTWVWLTDLSQQYGRALSLGNLPPECIDQITVWHPDAVWLMGVWERSPLGREVARNHPGLQFEFQRALPDFVPDDIVGSPYAVHRYTVDSNLGSADDLAAFRARLRERDIALILDYVPNHVAVDHHWTTDCPDCLLRGSQADLDARPSSYYTVPENGAVIAHGRDPYFPAWTDTAQVNAFSSEGRRGALQTVLDIANQCDGVRCDMAMLLVSRVFAQTWNIADMPATEFWNDVIPQVKKEHPHFTFMAEVYWDMEADMQALGFDYTYDKRLYDRLLHDPIYTAITCWQPARTNARWCAL
jgi:glycosidase